MATYFNDNLAGWLGTTGIRYPLRSAQHLWRRQGSCWQDEFMRALRRIASPLVVMMLLAGGPAPAQDLDAGKSGQGLFATNCSTCHRTPRGLAKSANRISLFYFLRQHYTASQTSAADLTAYLLAAGGEPARAKQKSTSRRTRQR